MARIAVAYEPSPRTASLVGGIGAVEADLDVEIVHRCQPARLVGIDERSVGRELDADPLRDRVLDEFEEVASDHRLAAADVDVEHLQVMQFVEHRFGLDRGEFAGIATARRRQAVHTLEVAGVGEFPREADRSVEPALQLVNEGGHATSPTRSRTTGPAGTQGNDPVRCRSLPAHRRRCRGARGR